GGGRQGFTNRPFAGSSPARLPSTAKEVCRKEPSAAAEEGGDSPSQEPIRSDYPAGKGFSRIKYGFLHFSALRQRPATWGRVGGILGGCRQRAKRDRAAPRSDPHRGQGFQNPLAERGGDAPPG